MVKHPFADVNVRDKEAMYCLKWWYLVFTE